MKIFIKGSRINAEIATLQTIIRIVYWLYEEQARNYSVIWLLFDILTTFFC